MDVRKVYQLSDALNPMECVLCNRKRQLRHDRMHTLLKEAVNDVEFRKRFKSLGGFCTVHGRELLALGSPLNHAILYDALYQHHKGTLTAGKNPFKTCMFCEGDEKNESRIIQTFIDALHNEVFRHAFDQTGTLCVAHHQHVHTLMPKKHPYKSWLQKVITRQYDELSKTLASIKNKHDYRHTSEQWCQTERDAWQKAAMLFSGNPPK